MSSPAAPKRTVAVFAALDTKFTEAEFVRDVIQAKGLSVLLVDTGVLGEPGVVADIDRSTVARAGGVELAKLIAAKDKSDAMVRMRDGAAAVASTLIGDGRIQGMLALGGTAGTTIGSAAMRTAPVGFPKMMVSTVGGGDVSPYVGTTDITMMPSVVDIAGINRISARTLSNAAGAIAGMVTTDAPELPDRHLIMASMFGNTTALVDLARERFERSGYEVLVFHATGTGGRTMESLIDAGYADGVFDVTTTEMADELCGGVFSAGPDRLRAAARSGVPQVVAPGCLDMVNFGEPETVPDRYRGRQLYEWNPSVTLMRTTPDECAELGRRFARMLNEALGPVTILLPLRGVSQLDSPGEPFWNPEADRALVGAIMGEYHDASHIVEVDANINDVEFADVAVNALLKSLTARSRG